MLVSNSPQTGGSPPPQQQFVGNCSSSQRRRKRNSTNVQAMPTTNTNQTLNLHRDLNQNKGDTENPPSLMNIDLTSTHALQHQAHVHSGCTLAECTQNGRHQSKHGQVIQWDDNSTTPTSIQQLNTTANPMHHQRTQHQQCNIVTSMESEPGGDFKLTKRKKKKKKIEPVQDSTESSSPTSSSVSLSDSTSSTNTNSVISRIDRPSTVQVPVNDANCFPIASTTSSIEISHEARRFAETRFPFPPIIPNFTRDLNEKMIVQAITNHFATEFNFHISIAGHRLKQKRQLLIFVTNRESFATVFNNQKRPAVLEGFTFQLVLPSHLPPQFSLILRNVPGDIDIGALLNHLKKEYPDLTNVSRIVNKNKQTTTLVRIDINNVNTIDELKDRKFIYFDNLRFSVAEYLAPARVLICSKCYQIGHFRSNCKSPETYCRTCGMATNDITQHKTTCNNEQRCVRCRGSHDSNDIRCPDVKSYRAALTKSLLTINNSAQPPQQQTNNNALSYQYRTDDFPSLQPGRGMEGHGFNNHCSISNKRIDELFNNAHKLEVNLNRLIDLNAKFSDQLTNIHQVIKSNNHHLQLHQVDISFQREFVSQFVSPICQVMVETLPNLVKQNMLNDKTFLCPSLTTLCTKFASDLPRWTSKFQENENTKAKLSQEYNAGNQQYNNEGPIVSNVPASHQ